MSTLELLKIFTEPQRLRILHLLKSAALNVNELVDILQVSQSNISHHLKILKNLGLIELQKRGNQNYYAAISSPKLPESLIKIWSDTSTLVSEMPESKHDERNLVMVLGARNSNDTGDFRDWRKKQPDLPFTHEFALAGLPSSDMAVDIGCGSGELLDIISRSFKKVTGIDISATQLLQAKENMTKNLSKNVRLICSDAEKLPLTDETANTVYYRMTLGFLRNHEKALQEAIRILKKKGRLSIIDKISNDNKKENNFTKSYFQAVCKKNGAQLLDYRLHQQVFICSIEKK